MTDSFQKGILRVKRRILRFCQMGPAGGGFPEMRRANRRVGRRRTKYKIFIKFTLSGQPAMAYNRLVHYEGILFAMNKVLSSFMAVACTQAVQASADRPVPMTWTGILTSEPSLQLRTVPGTPYIQRRRIKGC
ncbi:hypothetical protein GCWU000342_00022 [Shuttleworthella satelles DSM 14600]|uniref:Uncharacterized protein n=1 Tax=Shuttleworthella satelles DSM 14600 TaxID=626523 RepID=C4GA76_9FIRM|nr:hypothetical protein GCWU000342_00022 [Shuttleworthia satelles DSM 14600]